MQHNTFQELLDKYLTGRMTEQEWKIFSNMLNQPEHKNRLATIIDTELEEHAFESEPDNNLLANIQSQLHNHIRTDKERSKKIVFYITRLAVAAVFVVLLSAVAWWWIASKKPSRNEVAQNKTVKKETIIAPGGNRAILKLSDGSEIMLDSAGEGTLAQQGRAKVIKLGDGQLSYKPSNNTSAETVYNTIITPRGGQYQLTLADGTKVWLNAASSLRYPAVFSGNERKVELTGEGYFEVASIRLRSGQKMPFHVQTNSMDVEVLGTHFNINSYTDEPAIRTTLLEGSVKIVNRESAIVSRESAILKPGEQAILSGVKGTTNNKPAYRTGRLQTTNNIDIDEVMAWKNGLFQYKAADIEAVLRQAARWYDIQFEYKGDIRERFSGQIPRNVNADELLQILELTGKVKFDIHGKTIIVKPAS